MLLARVEGMTRSALWPLDNTVRSQAEPTCTLPPRICSFACSGDWVALTFIFFLEVGTWLEGSGVGCGVGEGRPEPTFAKDGVGWVSLPMFLPQEVAWQKQ